MSKRQSQADLERHLRSQLAFLIRSSSSYDDGFHDEALRLANALRVLFHQTNTSHSLLGQLNLQSKIRYLQHGDPAQ